LQRLREDPSFHVKNVVTRHEVNGSFHHYRVKYGEPNALSQYLAILFDGRTTSLERAERKLAKAHYKEWGKLNPRTARWLLDDPTRFYKTQTYSAWYNRETVSARQLEAFLSNFADDIDIAEHGPPVVDFRTTGTKVMEISKHEHLNMVMAALGEPTTSSAGVKPSRTAAGYTNSLNIHNKYGNYADDIEIGLVGTITKSKTKNNSDATSNGLYDTHNSIKPATVNHINSPKVCEPGVCVVSSPKDSARCILRQTSDSGTGECVNRHTSEVSSRIASSNENTLLHAAKAHLWVANDMVPDLGDAADIAEVYGELKEREADIVNESWALERSYFDAADYVRDWYARYERMTFVKASGNLPFEPIDEIVDCQALNVLCVGSANAEGTYDDITDDTFAGEAWENPKFALTNNKNSGTKQAERPDVVSDGVSTEVLDYSSSDPSDWDRKGGTSYSAPTVTGLVALYDRSCGPTSPELHRALMRTSAWKPHMIEDSQDDPRYPIPGQSPDSRAGAGIPFASWFLSCEGDSPDGQGGGKASGILDPTDDSSWTSVNEYMTSENFEETPNDNIITHRQPINRTKDHVKKKIAEFPVGTERVRMTFSYNTCPPSDGQDPRTDFGNVDKNVPAVDFDLVLCSDEKGGCVAVSDSRDDTNEGFDVDIPGVFQEVDDLSAYVVKPSADAIDSKGGACGGPFDGAEPWGAAWVYWY
jgi:hypothetical protein